MLLPIVKLKTPRNSRHPWIFKKMITPPRGITLDPGSLVEVRDRQNRFVGHAFFHPDNTIALRLLNEDPSQTIDARFLQNRLQRALDLRRQILPENVVAGAFRLVHAEADSLPGLVIDKFSDLLLIEPYVSGWLHIMDELLTALSAVLPGHRLAVRADPGGERKDGVSFSGLEKKHPAPPSVDIDENGILYRVDFQTGHKTGFFLDQRDNRSRVAAIARDRSVLDLCCYSGGFSLSAWKGGARSVLAVDLDEKAVAMADANIRLNRADGIRTVHADAFEKMRALTSAKEAFSLVILDPPKLASSREDVDKALSAYADMNRAAIGLVAPDGIFLTCSCSGAVPGERWRQAVRKAAADSGRELCIFETAGPGRDHPVSGDFPQGRYLKALFARVT